MPATDSPRSSRLKKPLSKPSDAACVEARLVAALKRPALEFLERGLTCKSMCLWWGWSQWACVAWLGAVFGFFVRWTRRGAGGVMWWSGFGGAGTWLWGLGEGLRGSVLLLVLKGAFSALMLRGLGRDGGSLRCLGALCLGSALVEVSMVVR